MPPSTSSLETGVGRIRWFAVATQPKRECWAITNLKRQGFVTYMPKRRVVVRHARRQKMVIRSFFPDYVFVRLDRERDRWRSINGTYGVRRLVMRGDRPLPAPHDLVETLQAMTDVDGFFMPRQAFERGERVRILSGPFRELIASVDEMTGEHRVKVLLEMMGGHIPVAVDRSELARAV